MYKYSPSKERKEWKADEDHFDPARMILAPLRFQ
jgi:hypothetical protein